MRGSIIVVLAGLGLATGRLLRGGSRRAPDGVTTYSVDEGEVRAARDGGGQPARGQGDAARGAAEQRDGRRAEDRVARARRHAT